MKVIVCAVSIFLSISTLAVGEIVKETGIADARQELLYFFNKHENRIFFNQPLLDALLKDWAMQAICKNNEGKGVGEFKFII